MDRGTLSVANPLIRNELGLSVAEMGVLLSAFLWPYAFTLLFAGAIVDQRQAAARPDNLADRLVDCPGCRRLHRQLWPVPAGPRAAGRRRGADVPDRGTGREGLVPRERPGAGRRHLERRPVARHRHRARPAHPGHAGVRLALDVRPDGSRWASSSPPSGTRSTGISTRKPSRSWTATTFTTAAQLPEAHPVHAAAWGKLFSFRATWGLILGFFGNVYVGWLFIAWLPGTLSCSAT